MRAIAFMAILLHVGCKSDDAEPDGTTTTPPTTTTDDPTSPPTGSVGVGPEGGTVASDDGLVSLEVPAGALDEPVEITITEASGATPPAGGFGPLYLLEPDGLVFQAPVRLAITYDPADLPPNTETVDLLYGDEGAWESADAVVWDDVADVVSGDITHFSLAGLAGAGPAIDGPGVYGDGRIPAVVMSGSTTDMLLIDPDTGVSEIVGTGTLGLTNPEQFMTPPRFLEDGRIVGIAQHNWNTFVYVQETDGTITMVYPKVVLDALCAVGLAPPNDGWIAFGDWGTYSHNDILGLDYAGGGGIELFSPGVDSSIFVEPTADGRAVFIGSGDAHVFDPGAGTLETLALTGYDPEAISALPTGQLAFLHAGAIYVMDAVPGAVPTAIPGIADADAYDLFALPDGRLAYAVPDAAGDNDIWVTDLAGNTKQVTATPGVEEKLKTVWH